MVGWGEYWLGRTRRPSRSSAARSAGERFASSSLSVKSGAAAMPIQPATRAPRRLAASSDSQPPMLEPISTTLPRAVLSITASESSSQAPIVPSVNAPPDSPWPE